MRRAPSRERRHTLSNVPDRLPVQPCTHQAFDFLVVASASSVRDCERLRAGRDLGRYTSRLTRALYRGVHG